MRVWLDMIHGDTRSLDYSDMPFSSYNLCIVRPCTRLSDLRPGIEY